MRHWTYQGLVDSVPRDFDCGRSQGRSIYMSLAMVSDGDESDPVESFIRHTFSFQMFAEKLGFVGDQSVRIYQSSMEKHLKLVKQDRSDYEFDLLMQAVNKTIEPCDQTTRRDYKWVKENIFETE